MNSLGISAFSKTGNGGFESTLKSGVVPEYNLKEQLLKFFRYAEG